MTWIECFVLSLRYDEDGNIINTPATILKNNKIDGDQEYIEEIFKVFDERSKSLEEKDLKEVIYILKAGAYVENDYGESHNGLYNEDESIFDYLSKDEMTRIMDLLYAEP